MAARTAFYLGLVFAANLPFGYIRRETCTPFGIPWVVVGGFTIPWMYYRVYRFGRRRHNISKHALVPILLAGMLGQAFPNIYPETRMFTLPPEMPLMVLPRARPLTPLGTLVYDCESHNITADPSSSLAMTLHAVSAGATTEGTTTLTKS